LFWQRLVSLDSSSADSLHVDSWSFGCILINFESYTTIASSVTPMQENDRLARSLDDKGQAGELHVSNPRRFVWHSDAESVAAGIPSILAIVESGAAAIAYVLIGYYLHTLDHLLISICIAPLLLLRSNQSVELGVKWFSLVIRRIADTETSPKIVSHPW
jgi:hypothetical protein